MAKPESHKRRSKRKRLAFILLLAACEVIVIFMNPWWDPGVSVGTELGEFSHPNFGDDTLRGKQSRVSEETREESNTLNHSRVSEETRKADNTLFEQHLRGNELGRCAIHLFGLPRAFRSLVLPSLIKNVLRPNARYSCDYFVHYYNISFEASSRSGQGGKLDPHEIRLLSKAINETQVTNTFSTVKFTMDEDSDFWKQRAALINELHTTKLNGGRPLYLPWKDTTYKYTTLDNIIKMWHSIQGSWQLMQEHAASTNITYTRVAMMRSDVVYMTPTDIWERGDNVAGKHYDVNNTHAVIPGFAKFPISDRMIYGPAQAVRIWADTRFAYLKSDKDKCSKPNSDCYGMFLHSESLLRRLLQQVKWEEHTTMCFFRVRVDESVWFQDCDIRGARKLASPHIQMPTSLRARQALIEKVLGRPCRNASIFKTPTRVQAIVCAEC